LRVTHASWDQPAPDQSPEPNRRMTFLVAQLKPPMMAEWRASTKARAALRPTISNR